MTVEESLRHGEENEPYFQREDIKLREQGRKGIKQEKTNRPRMSVSARQPQLLKLRPRRLQMPMPTNSRVLVFVRPLFSLCVFNPEKSPEKLLLLGFFENWIHGYTRTSVLELHCCLQALYRCKDAPIEI